MTSATKLGVGQCLLLLSLFFFGAPPPLSPRMEEEKEEKGRPTDPPPPLAPLSSLLHTGFKATFPSRLPNLPLSSLAEAAVGR